MKLLTLLLLVAALPAGAQTPPDTLGMPRLEIPEITIVGKKAITLPFAAMNSVIVTWSSARTGCCQKTSGSRTSGSSSSTRSTGSASRRRRSSGTSG